MSESSILTVQAIADQLGITLNSRSVISYLAQEAEFRISQILIPASILHKKTHTPKLTVQHINMVIASQRLPPLLGYSSSSGYNTRVISDDGDELCVVEDPQVQLSDVAKHITRPAPRSVPFSFQWVMVDGIPVERRSQNAGHVHLHSMFSPVSEMSSLRPFSEGSELSVTNKDVISTDLQNYFNHAIELFDSTDEEQQNSLFISLSCDSGIHPLLPMFIQFLSHKLTIELNDNSVVEKVCLYLYSLIENPSLPIPFFVHPLLRLVMTVILRYDSGSDVSTDLNLRRNCAEIVESLCNRCISGFPTIKTVIANAMIQILFGSESTLAAHCGALLVLSRLGIDIITKVAPHLQAYLKAIKREIKIGNPTQINFARNVLSQLEDILKLIIEKNIQPVSRYQAELAEIQSLLTKLEQQ